MHVYSSAGATGVCAHGGQSGLADPLGAHGAELHLDERVLDRRVDRFEGLEMAV